MQQVEARGSPNHVIRHRVTAGSRQIAPAAERRTQPLAAGGERRGEGDEILDLATKPREFPSALGEKAGQLRADGGPQFGRQGVGGVEVDHGLSLDRAIRQRCPTLAPMSTTRQAPSIAEMLASADHPTMSFEFFPPKDDAGQTQLLDAVAGLEPLRPDFVSVTYGASGSTRARTIDATRLIQTKTDAHSRWGTSPASASRSRICGARSTPMPMPG